MTISLEAWRREVTYPSLFSCREKIKKCEEKYNCVEKVKRCRGKIKKCSFSWLLRGQSQCQRPQYHLAQCPCHAFFVATHTDRQHIHNHIYYNSTSLDCAHKFRDFIGSARAVRRLSDRVCLENDLSVIANPKLHSKGRFLHYGAWAGADRQPSYKERLRHAIRDALAKGPADFNAFLRLMEEAGFTVKQGRGGAISFLVPGQQRATRLRSSTLGEGYDPEDIRAVIAGKRPLPEVGVPAPAAPARVNLIVDIQERLRDRKGPAYERWAKIYNLKQMAAALQFMQEHGLTEYNQLAAQTEEAVQRFHVLTGQLRQTEANLAHTSEVMGAVVQYAKTRPVFDGYKATKYSKKYLAAHEAELADYRAAKAILNDLLDGARLPRMPELKEKRRTLAAQKRHYMRTTGRRSSVCGRPWRSRPISTICWG